MDSETELTEEQKELQERERIYEEQLRIYEEKTALQKLTEPQRYAAMARHYYQLSADTDRNIINWSSLALTGLLAFAVSAHEDSSFIKVLWALGVIFFALACVFTHINMRRSVRWHGKKINNFFTEIPLEYDEKNDKALRRGNTLFLSCFALGAVCSIALVGLIVFC
jgi:hypothetical protein